MAAAIGLAFAFALLLFGRISGLDRDRAFYAVSLIVVASYHLVFAAMAESAADLKTASLALALFGALAVAGFRTSLWLVASGLALHGVYDVLFHPVASNGGMPDWWPSFCLAFDVAAAAGLVVLLSSGAVRARGA